MKGSTIVIIAIAVIFSVLAGWAIVFISSHKEPQKKKDSNRIYWSTDTVEVCRVRYSETNLVFTFSKDGNVIDTFTLVPVFDSILINHSKIP